MGKYKIDIANDFSPKLGGRWVKLGRFSGEQFFQEVLEKKYLDAIANNEKLYIYMDGASPYGSSFIDQSFGELGRIHGKSKVKDTIVFNTELYGWLTEYIREELWA